MKFREKDMKRYGGRSAWAPIQGTVHKNEEKKSPPQKFLETAEPLTGNACAITR